MSCVVVGAGLAGASVAYHLSKLGIPCTVWDDKLDHTGFRAGMMHPYPSKKCLLTKYASEGMGETIKMLNDVEAYLEKPVCLRNGIFRSYWDGKPNFPDVEEVDCGYLIKSGITIYTNEFIDGLLKVSKAPMVRKRVTSLDELDKFDHVILACGSGIAKFGFDLPIQLIKGHVLTGRHADVKFERTYIGDCYVIPLADGSYQVGSTYEHHAKSPDVDEEVARKLLAPKMNGRVPPLEEWKDVKFFACTRVSQKGSYLPIYRLMDPRTTVITALGSRGFIYAGWMAKKIAKEISDKKFK